MTKDEAIRLENRCDKIMSGYLGLPCTVSLALSGKLRVEFNDGDYITWNMTCNEVDYVSFIGFYDELVKMIGEIRECVNDNRDIFDNLLWSYNNRREFDE